MKKRIEKKISLSKETLRNLSEREMQNVAGGASIACISEVCTEGGSCETFRCGGSRNC
jgi:natural product precursor